MSDSKFWQLENSVMFFHHCSDYDREQFAENPVPLLLIGTKFDQIPENKRNEVLTRTAFLSEDFNAEEINLVCQLFTLFFFLIIRKLRTSMMKFELKIFSYMCVL